MFLNREKSPLSRDNKRNQKNQKNQYSSFSSLGFVSLFFLNLANLSFFFFFVESRISRERELGKEDKLLTPNQLQPRRKSNGAI